MSRCNFRPLSFAENEMGCPLDHCEFCRGHVEGWEPGQSDQKKNHTCPGSTQYMEHARRFYEKYTPSGDPDTADGDEEAAWYAFVCGQDECPRCAPPGEDPVGALGDYE